MYRLTQGLRHTFRQLAKSPVFVTVAILTIALGIGANTAIFSVMNVVLLRSLPVPDPKQLVYFHPRNQPLSTSQTLGLYRMRVDPRSERGRRVLRASGKVVWRWPHVVAADAGCYANSIGGRSEG